MEFDIEWNLQEFRNEQHELFDENGKRYTGVSLSNDTAEAMLKLINDLECALVKCSKENAALPIFDVRRMLPDEMDNIKAKNEWLKKNKREFTSRGEAFTAGYRFCRKWILDKSK